MSLIVKNPRRVPAIKILEAAGVDITFNNGAEVRPYDCPICHEDGDFSVNVSGDDQDGCYFCHRNNEGGSWQQLAKLYEVDLDTLECNWDDAAFNKSSAIAHTPKSPIVFASEELDHYTAALLADHGDGGLKTWLNKRCISDDTIKNQRLGLSAKPDGSDEQQVPLGGTDGVEIFSGVHWSPDGRELLIDHTLRIDPSTGQCCLPFRPAIVKPDGSDYKVLTMPYAPFDGGCGVWSLDQTRLLCGFGGDHLHN